MDEAGIEDQGRLVDLVWDLSLERWSLLWLMTGLDVCGGVLALGLELDVVVGSGGVVGGSWV